MRLKASAKRPKSEEGYGSESKRGAEEGAKGVGGTEEASEEGGRFLIFSSTLLRMAAAAVAEEDMANGEGREVRSLCGGVPYGARYSGLQGKKR